MPDEKTKEAPAAKSEPKVAPPEKAKAVSVEPAVPAPPIRGDIQKQMDDQHAKLERMKKAIEHEQVALDRMIAVHNSLPKA